MNVLHSRTPSQPVLIPPGVALEKKIKERKDIYYLISQNFYFLRTHGNTRVYYSFFFNEETKYQSYKNK